MIPLLDFRGFLEPIFGSPRHSLKNIKRGVGDIVAIDKRRPILKMVDHMAHAGACHYHSWFEKKSWAGMPICKAGSQSL